MTEQPFHLRSDGDLEAGLRALGEAIDWPAAAAPDGSRPDLAAAVRARIESIPRTVEPARPRWSWRPARWGLVAAVLLLLALAVVAAAAGLGLPGLRLIFGPAPVSPPPSLAPASLTPTTGTTTSPGPAASGPDASLALGEPVPLDELDARAGFAVTWPADPALGPPDAAYIDPALGGQVALVWHTRENLPSTLEPGIALVLTEFQGAIDDSFFSKALGNGTTATTVLVDGERGLWLSGDPHFLFYTGPDGFIHDPRRWIGDALIWARGPITYRLETSLGRDAAIRIAGSMP
jgi:hypothetical protein